MAIDPRTPVLVGVGQVVDRWDGGSPAEAPSPIRLAIDAARLALADTGAAQGIGAAIDRVVVVRTMLDSIPGGPQPFGRCANPPGTLAATLELAPAQTIYSVVGGDQPQALVNEAAEALYAGKSKAVLLAGAEATAAMKLGLKRGLALDWSHSVDDAMNDRGLGPMLLSAHELANGLGAPVQTYPLFEHALRSRLGLSREQHVELMSELWAGFSRIAASNRYAQFPTFRDATFLASPSADNFPIADPYLRWHVAQDGVNQGAACVLTTAGLADELGILADRRVYLHGYAQAAERLVSERPDLSRSPALEATLQQALQTAGKTADQIDFFDLYSCFPCAVLMAAEALGLDWRSRPTTVTGGLPFFGGAGNNYSMHAIATMADRLRTSPGAYGLVHANGGFLSKQAVGIYSSEPPAGWGPISSATIQKSLDEGPSLSLHTEAMSATIETFTVGYDKGVPSKACVIGRSPFGRVIARTRSGDHATVSAFLTGEPIGRTVRFASENGRTSVVGVGNLVRTKRGAAAT